jgi:hypothetical protein
MHSVREHWIGRLLARWVPQDRWPHEEVEFPRSAMLFGDAESLDRALRMLRTGGPQRFQAARDLSHALGGLVGLYEPAYTAWLESGDEQSEEGRLYLFALPTFLGGVRRFEVSFRVNDAQPLMLRRVQIGTNPRFGPFLPSEFAPFQREPLDVVAPGRSAYEATAWLAFERRGIDLDDHLLPPRAALEPWPRLERVVDTRPAWSGWSKRAGLTGAMFGIPIVLQKRGLGPFILWATVAGGWSDEAVQTMRSRTAELLPWRHVWLLEEVGRASLVVHVSGRRTDIELARASLSRVGVALLDGVLVERGTAIPQGAQCAPLDRPTDFPAVLQDIDRGPRPFKPAVSSAHAMSMTSDDEGADWRWVHDELPWLFDHENLLIRPDVWDCPVSKLLARREELLAAAGAGHAVQER